MKPPAARVPWAFVGVQIISMFGEFALWVVLAVLVKDLTGSSGLAGLIAFAISAPLLAAPWMGLIIDRSNRKATLVAVQCVGAISVALLYTAGRETVWVVFVVTVILGAVSGIISAAQSAIVRDLLGPDARSLAMTAGAVRTAQQALRIVAPPLGVIIFSHAGASWMWSLNIAVFIVAALGTLALELPDHRSMKHADQQLRPDLDWRDGLRFLRDEPSLKALTSAAAVSLLGLGMSSTLVFTLSDAVGRQATFVAYLEGAVGVGALVGAPLGSWQTHRAGPLPSMVGALLIMVVGFILLLIHQPLAALAGMVIIGIGIPWTLIALFLTVQVEAPQNLQGRAYAAVQLATSAPQAAAVAIGALVVPLLGARWATTSITALMVCALIRL